MDVLQVLDVEKVSRNETQTEKRLRRYAQAINESRTKENETEKGE